MTLEKFNKMHLSDATDLLMKCCTAKNWVTQMCLHRPYDCENDLFTKACAIWSKMFENDILEAFEGHPKIGDINSLAKKYRDTASFAQHEQKTVSKASERSLSCLAELNDQYQKKFGFIFIVYASGKSASDMLSLLKSRLSNDRKQELVIAASEQQKIMLLRLRNLF